MSCSGCSMRGSGCALKSGRASACLSRRGRTGVPDIPRKTPLIWTIVADSRIARIFAKSGAGISLVREIMPATEAARRDTSHFARMIASWLDGQADGGAFDRLVLVACPPMLGELRRAFGSRVGARVFAELNNDIAGMAADDLRAELSRILWF